MAMQYRKVLYGGAKGIDVTKANIANIASEAGSYLKENGMQAQGIKLPGLSDAQKLVAKAVKQLGEGMKSKFAQELGGSPELKVVGGIDVKGNLSATVTGILPPTKKGGKPVMFDETAVIRKDWGKLEEELKADKLKVVSLQDDPVVKGSADRLAGKGGGKAKTKDEGDFGEITTGTVALVAHGERVNVNGITLGTKLGKMTPKEVVEYLTGQKDPKKNLSKDFKGTVLLMGCFTAAGGIAPPNSDYDYETFAGKVWNLLKAKGIKCKVQGNPGQGRVLEGGGTASVKPTEQAEYDRLKKEVRELGALLKKAQQKLSENDPKVKAAAQKKINEIMPKLKKANAEKELKVMRELIGSYGLDPVR